MKKKYIISRYYYPEDLEPVFEFATEDKKEAKEYCYPIGFKLCPIKNAFYRFDYETKFIKDDSNDYKN